MKSIDCCQTRADNTWHSKEETGRASSDDPYQNSRLQERTLDRDAIVMYIFAQKTFVCVCVCVCVCDIWRTSERAELDMAMKFLIAIGMPRESNERCVCTRMCYFRSHIKYRIN